MPNQPNLPRRSPDGEQNQRQQYHQSETPQRQSSQQQQRPPSSQSQQRPSGGSPRYPRETESKGIAVAKKSFSIAFIVVAIIGTLLLCLFFATFILESASDLFGLNQEEKEVNLTIAEEGMTTEQLTNLLFDLNVIEKKSIFKMYSGMKYDEENPLVIKTGEYTLNHNMSYDQIFSILKTGNIEDRLVTITFKEQETIDDIAKRLEESNVCTAEDFISYLQKEQHLRYSFYNKIPTDDEFRYLKMEGYVFPDTYEFYINSNVTTVADKFLENFDRKINNDEMLSRMSAKSMELDDVVTLASVIQREAGDYNEMTRVSSVFHNRLKSSNFPSLQSDVTIFYVEDHIKNQNRSYTISESQDLYDAYNTYVREGLPAGPICNPGMDAIMAAIYPADTGYYYFFTDNEGTYHYSVTLAEHEQKLALIANSDEEGAEVVGGVNTHKE